MPFIHTYIYVCMYRKASAQCGFCKAINPQPSLTRFPSTWVVRNEIVEANEAFLKTLHGLGVHI